MQDLLTIKEIFKERIFRIPDYQRGYSWETEHLEDFWNDLKNISNDGQHYTGVITVQKPKDEDEKSYWRQECKNIRNRPLYKKMFFTQRGKGAKWQSIANFASYASLRDILTCINAIECHEESKDIFFTEEADFTIVCNEYGKKEFPKVIEWKKKNRRSFYIKTPQGQFEVFYIVDGQQRLTTILILLALIRNKYKNSKEKTKATNIEELFICTEVGEESLFLFGYTTNIPSHEFLISQIFSNPSKDFEGDKDLYTSRIEKAKSFFEEKLQRYDAKKLEELCTKITTQLKFNYYEIDTSLNIFTIFETLNNRGKPLSILEKLKNRLIFLSTQNDLINPFDNNPFIDSHTAKSKFDKKRKELREKINETWKTMYKYLGHDAEKILSDDEFLRIHWIMYFNHTDDKEKDFDKYADNLLKERFAYKNRVNLLIIKNVHECRNHKIEITDKVVYLFDYLDSLSTSVEWWYYMNFLDCEKNKIDNEVRFWLKKIARIKKGSYFKPLILALLQKECSINDKCEILQQIERHNFLVFLAANSNANANRTLFRKKANQFLTTLTTEELSYDIKENTIEQKKKNVRFGFYSFDKFEKNIHDNKNNEKRFYDWGEWNNSIYIKYVLYEYELCLKEKYENELSLDEKNEIIWMNFEIQLIFPESGATSKHCDEDIRGLGNTNKLKLCYSLGNLLLVKRTITDYSFYERKISEEYNSYSEKELFEKYPVWNIRAVYERGLDILNWMEERWDFEIKDGAKKTTGDEKTKLLLPDFPRNLLE